MSVTGHETQDMNERTDLWKERELLLRAVRETQAANNALSSLLSLLQLSLGARLGVVGKPHDELVGIALQNTNG